MKRGTIKIDSNNIIVNGDVWLAEFEIAELFGVRYSDVKRVITTVFKSRALYEDRDMKYITLENGNRADVYSIEVVTAIAFLLNTQATKIYRKWIISKATRKAPSTPPLFINLNSGGIC